MSISVTVPPADTAVVQNQAEFLSALNKRKAVFTAGMIRALIAVAMLAIASIAPAATVTTQAGLVAAIKAGEPEVSLAAGTTYTVPYGAKNLTIASADPAKPATITSVGSGLSNVTISHVVFDAGNVPLAVINSQRVTVADSVVRATNARVRNGNSMAVRVSGSSDVMLSRLSVSGGDVSIYLTTSSNVSLIDSDISNIGRDGVNAYGNTNLLIARNHFRGWHFIGDEHPDVIQVWTNAGHAASVGVVITDNLGECAPDMRAQGIFSRDEGKLWLQGKGHRDFIVSGNVLTNTMWNGIYFENIAKAVANDNVLLFEINPLDVDKADNQASKRTWIKVDGAAEVKNNVAGQFIGGAQSNNTIKLTATKSEIDKAVAGWRAKFRSPPMTLEQRVDRLERTVGLVK